MKILKFICFLVSLLLLTFLTIYSIATQNYFLLLVTYIPLLFVVYLTSPSVLMFFKKKIFKLNNPYLESIIEARFSDFQLKLPYIYILKSKSLFPSLKIIRARFPFKGNLLIDERYLKNFTPQELKSLITAKLIGFKTYPEISMAFLVLLLFLSTFDVLLVVWYFSAKSFNFGLTLSLITFFLMLVFCISLIPPLIKKFYAYWILLIDFEMVTREKHDLLAYKELIYKYHKFINENKKVSKFLMWIYPTCEERINKLALSLSQSATNGSFGYPRLAFSISFITVLASVVLCWNLFLGPKWIFNSENVASQKATKENVERSISGFNKVNENER